MAEGIGNYVAHLGVKPITGKLSAIEVYNTSQVNLIIIKKNIILTEDNVIEFYYKFGPVLTGSGVPSMNIDTPPVKETSAIIRAGTLDDTNNLAYIGASFSDTIDEVSGLYIHQHDMPNGGKFRLKYRGSFVIVSRNVMKQIDSGVVYFQEIKDK